MKKIQSFFKKTIANVLVVFAIVSAVFFLMFLIPGDPVDFILQDGANLEDKEQLRQELGLNKSFISQYASFLWRALHLDLGQSIHTGDLVVLTIAQQFPWTLSLSLLSLFMALAWALPLALVSSHPFFKSWEKVFDFFPLVFFSIPVFVSAPLLIWFFAERLAWFPVSGYGGFSHLFLPSLSLALPLGAVLMKVGRASILEVSSSDFVRTAQAKGLSQTKVYFRHVLKNAVIPIITVLGLQMGALLTGTVIVESLFDRPGIGHLLYQSIVSRDYPLVQALVLFIALIYVFINRWTDWLYSVFNPFMKEE